MIQGELPSLTCSSLQSLLMQSIIAWGSCLYGPQTLNPKWKEMLHTGKCWPESASGAYECCLWLASARSKHVITLHPCGRVLL